MNTTLRRKSELKVASLTPATFLMKAHANRPIRISPSLFVPRPLNPEDREHFRALRALEMAVWEASGGDFFRRVLNPRANSHQPQT